MFLPLCCVASISWENIASCMRSGSFSPRIKRDMLATRKPCVGAASSLRFTTGTNCSSRNCVAGDIIMPARLIQISQWGHRSRRNSLTHLIDNERCCNKKDAPACSQIQNCHIRCLPRRLLNQHEYLSAVLGS